MNRVWARVGVTLTLTDEEYEKLRVAALDKESTRKYGVNIYRDLEPDLNIDQMFKNGSAEFDGDTYIPSEEFYWKDPKYPDPIGVLLP